MFFCPVPQMRAAAAAEKAAREAEIAAQIAAGTYVPPPPPTAEEEAAAALARGEVCVVLRIRNHSFTFPRFAPNPVLTLYFFFPVPFARPLFCHAHSASRAPGRTRARPSSAR